MKLRHSGRTDVGQTREHNEDCFGVGEGESVTQLGVLFVVCDGMGGHAAGEVASRMAVDLILASYYGDDSEDRPFALRQAFEQANAQIYTHGRGTMGTTGVAALAHHDALHIANVGDSRAYLIRDGQVRQISRDHSFVSDQVAAGLITADQARLSPHRNVITRALGYQPEVTVDLFRIPLQVGDVIVLSSDGLHGMVSDTEIARMAIELPPDQSVGQLIDLANQRGGPDNITVVIVCVDALDWDSSPTEDPAASHHRDTIELPPTEPSADVAAAPPAPAPASASPARPVPRSTERRLTLLGALLATVLLTVMIFAILFVLQSSRGAPAAIPPTASAPTASPAPATTLPTTGSTAAPTAEPEPIPTAP